ncbi:restriction endonuclease subunit S [Pseudoalteromonas sp. CF6-2]|uniref:restriction endonuclease subunit S n=1 Tax=Pseudoalteromonas sp. CF6-2 TaxID=562716 RepID=UPI001EFF9A1F|nr:restriction endonuclease subunit S [Pseudoalteromonas sp. CF6-2]
MSWPVVKMSEIFDIARGGSPRPIDQFITDAPDGVNWIMIGDTKGDSKYIDKTAKKIKPEGVKKSREVKKGDFLLTNSMSFGRPYILRTSGCIHDGWLVLSPKTDQIFTDYFYHYLGSTEVKNKLASKAAGAVVKNLNKDIVKDLEIPLPPLEEQKRIAAILDKADSVRRKRQQAIDLADDFLRSVFLDMFGDPVLNPKGLPQVKLTELSDVISGYAFKSAEYIDDGEDSVRLCRGANTLTGYFDWKDTVYWNKEKLAGIQNYKIKSGDVILAMDRPWISSGLKVCVFPENERDTYLVQRVARIRPKNPKYTDFLYASILSKAFEKHCCPTETTVPHISPVELKNFNVLVPDEKLVEKYHDAVVKVRKSKLAMQKSAVEASNAFNSLSQKSFAGEL